MNSFNAKASLKVGGKTYTIYHLGALGKDISRLPFSIRILLENLLRTEDGVSVKQEDIKALANWAELMSSPNDSVGDLKSAKNRGGRENREIAFTPARVILQDFTGVPCVVDLAAMRDQMVKMGKDPKKINPLQPVDLVIDHSVQVDSFGTPSSFQENVEKEFVRNKERYQFLRWGQQAFHNFRAVPPGTGIVHQVNLEYLAPVVMTEKGTGDFPGPGRESHLSHFPLVYPDTLVGTDSHTTMINGLGVLGWGVGGIEAEAAMLGQPISMLIPEVVGFKLTGILSEGVTATDLVLTVTQMLRKKGVVGKFVEFYGSGLAALPLADRATIANMAPEYGATVGIFPVDEQTLEYLKLTGRPQELIQLVEAYYKEQGLFGANDGVYSESLELDLSTVEPSLAGPKRPQDRVALQEVKTSFRKSLIEMVKHKGPQLDSQRLQNWMGEGGNPRPSQVKIVEEDYGALSHTAGVESKNGSFKIGHGSVVIAAITSCTNTSNPAVMLGAGLLAKKAVARGLQVKPWVKTSLAPGSKVVIDYLKEAGLLPYLEKLRFHLVGFGCTTCIGNSGPLPPEIGAAIKEHDLVAAAVLSGNRNFEGRINPLVRANYLGSPPLVVAYALAGTVDTHLTHDPIGKDSEGKPVYLKDIWPTQNEIQEAMAKVKTKMFESEYSNVFEGDAAWKSLRVPSGNTFVWEAKSTYVRKPPYFHAMPAEPSALHDIRGARVLAVLGDSVTTDHISPAGSIAKDSPAAQYLMANGVEPKDFNSYGARRGNHEVMMRGTFANIRLKNYLVPGVEGPYSKYEGQQMFIYDAAMKYQAANIPLLVIAGKEYGSGSSRDWAAKGPALLGVKAVMAQSFERIHRSNLVGMGILPLEFSAGQNYEALELSGEEIYAITGIAQDLTPGKKIKVTASGKEFYVKCRIDTPVELAYYRHGGILQYVLRQLGK